MAEKIKVRFKDGAREIEIEASRNDIDQLLEKWWVEGAQQDDSGDNHADEQQRPKSKRPTRKTKAVSLPEGSFDPNELANEIKQHSKLRQIEKKIIHVKGDPFNKIALVLWVAEEALTSGDIYRTLSGMDVKADLPTISKTLKKNSSKFLTSVQRKVGGPPAAYRLSAQAKSDFEKWLDENGG